MPYAIHDGSSLLIIFLNIAFAFFMILLFCDGGRIRTSNLPHLSLGMRSDHNLQRLPFSPPHHNLKNLKKPVSLIVVLIDHFACIIINSFFCGIKRKPAILSSSCELDFIFCGNYSEVHVAFDCESKIRVVLILANIYLIIYKIFLQRFSRKTPKY